MINYRKAILVFSFLILKEEFIFGNPPTPPYVPIDGGLSFLVLSGVIYGIYETLKRR